MDNQEIIFLQVDYITYVKGFAMGQTRDVKKIYRNLDLLGELGKELQQYINIELLFAERRATTFHSLGRYICITTLDNDPELSSMQFIDFDFLTETQWEQIATEYHPESADVLMHIYREIVSLFSLDDDFYRLSASPL